MKNGKWKMEKRRAPRAGTAGLGIGVCIFDSGFSGGPSVARERGRGNDKKWKINNPELKTAAPATGGAASGFSF
jgi:hypothetical protein